MGCKNQLLKNIQINIWHPERCRSSWNPPAIYRRSLDLTTPGLVVPEAVFCLWTSVHRQVFNEVVCFGSLLCFRFLIKPVQWLYNSITYSTCLSSPNTRAVITKITFQITKYQAVKTIFLLLMHLYKIFTFDRYNKLNKTVCSEHTRPWQIT